MATTIALTNEPKTGKPRTLTITVNSVNLTYSVDLNDTDGSLIIGGKNNIYQYNNLSVSTTTDPTLQAAKDAFALAVADAYATLYKVINS